MKKILITLTILIVSFNIMADHNVFHNSGNIMIMPIVEVIDGDTIRSSLSLPVPLNKLSIRLANIDTPESTWRSKCLKEKILGLEAKEFLKDYLKSSKIMILRNFKYGTYAGRIIAEVYVDDVNIGNMLIEKGYAKLYSKFIKPDWCS